MNEKELIITKDPFLWVIENLERIPESSVIIFPSERELQRFLSFHSPSGDEGIFFSHDVFPFEDVRVSAYVRNHRMSCLSNLQNKNIKRIYTSLDAILRKTLPPEAMKGSTKKIRIDDPFGFHPDKLVEMGYERVFTVVEPGQFSWKGEVVDIFVPGSVLPYRLILFDDIVEEIKLFDPGNQRSVKHITEIEIFPAGEVLTIEENVSLAKLRIENAEKATGKRFSISPLNWQRMDTVVGLFYRQQAWLGDYLGDDCFFLFVDPEEGLKDFELRERETLEILSNKEVEKFIYRRFGTFSPTLLYSVKKYGLISKREVETFEWTSLKYEDVKATRKNLPRKQEKYLPKAPVFDWSELEEGDFVVHIEYGIGKFLGIRKINSVLGTREYLTIEYREGSKIYVPIERLDRVHKYVGDTDNIQLNSLRGNAWKKRKKRVEKEVKERIKELALLYGTREHLRGLSLKGDPTLEDAFKRSFPHLETEDQAKAIEEVLDDLADEKPMDRLVSGDAGYGKTEVALRAAFRAVVSGKQVSILVPTTVLARQHYETFKNRLEPFGVNVDILDRYRTPKERQKILRELKNGKIDVIIGTHSLLSKDVRFADLGLVIIDEEQLFGVMQKEHLKKLRLEVNVLTMSATPIPRTLYMALSGLRELSMIATPPIGRTMPETYVGPVNDRLIRTAVLREINRGGQVIYVHNRVNELNKLEIKIRKLLPEVEIGVAHGQMPKRLFEKNVGDFYSGKLQMLLCTTIIESGVDIPNANTLIVDDSQRYGLAQLYQLRGRVGRSTRRAFAYFLYNPKRLTPKAKERLKALREFSGPGSGMKLAIKDMEIRGFGELLGKEQHGNISSIGLYLYKEMVERAVAEARGIKELEPLEEKFIDTELHNIPYDMVIPEEYINDSFERMKIYRRIAMSRSVEEITEIEEELKDRFGSLPDEVRSLLDAARIRIAAYNLSIKFIEYDPHSEAVIIGLKESGKKNVKIFDGLRNIFNEKESKVILYNIKEEKLLDTIKAIFLGDDKDDS